jgi:hypothetical protein
MAQSRVFKTLSGLMRETTGDGLVRRNVEGGHWPTVGIVVNGQVMVSGRISALIGASAPRIDFSLTGLRTILDLIFRIERGTCRIGFEGVSGHHLIPNNAKVTVTDAGPVLTWPSTKTPGATVTLRVIG